MSEPYTETALFIDGQWVALEPYSGEKSAQFLFKHVTINPLSREQFETEARDLFAGLMACSLPVLMWRTKFEVNFETDFETKILIGRAYARGVFVSWHNMFREMPQRPDDWCWPPLNIVAHHARG